MSIQFNLKSGSCSGSQNSCLPKDGCVPGVCPDFIIRRHDTRPSLKIAVADCEGPMDLRGLVIEANMWALAKLKTNINATIDYFRLADDVGFEQIMIGDIIYMDRVRLPERMLVTGFDEANKLVRVERGYHGTTPSSWNRGTTMRIFRMLNAPAEAEMIYEDVENIDGSVDSNVLTSSYLIYHWLPEDTCLPGCYWVEFKILKMIDLVLYLPGGHWEGPTYQDDDGYYWTGSESTDSSIKLSYDQINDRYLIDSRMWAGEFHLWSDGNYYTGTEQNDGSVILNKTGVSVSDETSYTVQSLAVSVTPSFTDENLSSYYFGCVLGEGVESTRRLPLVGEGFLIRIVDSPTTEL